MISPDAADISVLGLYEGRLQRIPQILGFRLPCNVMHNDWVVRPTVIARSSAADLHTADTFHW
jgi:hypothetical protein